MLSKSFFGSPKPAFHYELLSKAIPHPMAIPVPDTITLLLPRELDAQKSETVKVGMKVKTGQKLSWDEQIGPSVISSVSGTIESVSSYIGDYGRKYTAIGIAADPTDIWDESFTDIGSGPDLKTLAAFFNTAPGAPAFEKLMDPKKPIQTILIYGGDTDLLIETNLFILKNRIAEIDAGIQAIKAASGIDKIILAVPGESFQNYDSHFHAEVINVPGQYPAGQPLMIFYQLSGKVLEQGQSFEDAGVLLIKAEAVASIGRALAHSRVPVEKMVTVVDKNGHKRLISTRIGTPLGHILKALKITLNDKDRIIFGGPMTGTAVYSEEQPIQADTDAVMVQDSSDIIFSSDYPCINCGDCIPVCPAKIQVSMLVRFLEAGQYQEGADLYDLYSCVECGLCSFVCVSRIPILQYIKLAKFELARMMPAEEENE
jgi:electron transport complex protein RnfC